MDKVNQHLLEVVSRIYTSLAEKGWYHSILSFIVGIVGDFLWTKCSEMMAVVYLFTIALAIILTY